MTFETEAVIAHEPETGGSCTIGNLSVADYRAGRCVFLPESLTSPPG